MNALYEEIYDRLTSAEKWHRKIKFTPNVILFDKSTYIHVGEESIGVIVLESGEVDWEIGEKGWWTRENGVPDFYSLLYIKSFDSDEVEGKIFRREDHRELFDMLDASLAMNKM